MAGAALGAVLTALAFMPAAAQERVNPQAAAMKAFVDRVNDYVSLTKKLDDGLPKLAPTDDTAKTDARQKALAERVREARKDAKRGDIFGTAEPYFREAIAKDSSRRSTRDKNAALEEVPAKDPLRVNAYYPEKAALATVPPLLLSQLQPLPDGIEYRFMGNDLILRDAKTNLVIDFINHSVPGSTR
jgi:hypothetical protein